MKKKNLPEEFVLKKYILALIIELNIFSCNFLEAFIKSNTKKVVLTINTVIIENVKTVKIITQVSRDINHPNSLLEVSSVLNDVLLFKDA